MIITGKFKNDGNFTHVFANNTIYTIASTGEWACVSVGEVTAFGQILKKEDYEMLEKGCENEGQFELK